ncbi:hypothetical protein [Paraburkholderia solisilvae]|uniref:hypothetical protein n=1 Tax=Paraburkholderia solisilvae TaxID=624376 RepID=UPI001582DB33|nr:hypothetical protein [Paraburkholderia solisilvae]
MNAQTVKVVRRTTDAAGDGGDRGAYCIDAPAIVVITAMLWVCSMEDQIQNDKHDQRHT